MGIITQENIFNLEGKLGKNWFCRPWVKLRFYPTQIWLIGLKYTMSGRICWVMIFISFTRGLNRWYLKITIPEREYAFFPCFLKAQNLVSLTELKQLIFSLKTRISCPSLCSNVAQSKRWLFFTFYSSLEAPLSRSVRHNFVVHYPIDASPQLL